MKALIPIIITAALFAPLPCLADQLEAVASSRPDSAVVDTTRYQPSGQNTADENKIKIVKRKIDTRQFVVLAIGMMAFIGLILATTQSWNPGGRIP
jgi:hypothetical protein